MRELVAFPIRLKRSRQSHTKTILYSADAGVSLGTAKAPIGVYIPPSLLPSPYPEAILIVPFAGEADDREKELEARIALNEYLLKERHETFGPILVPLEFNSKKSEGYRYDPIVPVIGTVYLPKKLIGKDPPKTCFVELTQG